MNRNGTKQLNISSRIFSELKLRAKKRGRILHANFADDVILLGLEVEKNLQKK